MAPEESRSTEGPREILGRMQQNQALGEKMDPQALLSDIWQLKELGATENPLLQERILKPFGQDPRIESAVADGYSKASSQNDQVNLTKYTRLAELLGIDQPIPPPALPLTVELPPAEEPEAEAPNPPEQPGIPVYNKPWQTVFGAEAKLLGDSPDALVYQPENNPGVVVKVFKRLSVLEAEDKVLSELQGSKHFPRLLGRGSDYLIKEYINGQNMLESYSEATPFPIEAGQTVSDEQKEVAAWFISSMEALAEIHERGFTVTDFKWEDWLWDRIGKRTVIIDLGNTQNTKELPLNIAKGQYLKDINKVLRLLFNKITTIGLSMEESNLSPAPKWPNKQEYLSKEGGEVLMQEALRLGSVDSLKRIIEIHAGAMWNQETAATAGVYIQLLKDYFKEVGISQIPTENRGAADLLPNPFPDRTTTASQPPARETTKASPADLTSTDGGKEAAKVEPLGITPDTKDVETTARPAKSPEEIAKLPDDVDFSTFSDLLLSKVRYMHGRIGRVDFEDTGDGYSIAHLLRRFRISRTQEEWNNLRAQFLSEESNQNYLTESELGTAIDLFRDIENEIPSKQNQPLQAASETILTPERQALEQTAAQQAESLFQQTGAPITEADLVRYEQWKQLQKEEQG